VSFKACSTHNLSFAGLLPETPRRVQGAAWDAYSSQEGLLRMSATWASSDISSPTQQQLHSGHKRVPICQDVLYCDETMSLCMEWHLLFSEK